MDDVRGFLHSVGLFAGLSPEELDELGRSVERMNVASGAVLVEEGTPGDSFYMLKSGRVRVERQRGGKSVPLAELGSGAFFGEMALIDGSPHSARIVALEPCEVLTISRLDLDVILHWNTALGQRFWRAVAQVLAQRLRRGNDVLFAQVGAERPDVETLRKLIQPE